MNTRPTPETDKFFATFADGEAAPSHAEYYARLQDLERERDEARAETIRWISIAKGRGRTEDEGQNDEWRDEHDRVAREYQHRLYSLATAALAASNYPERNTLQPIKT